MLPWIFVIETKTRSKRLDGSDAGLISFEDSGRMLVSSELKSAEQQIYNVLGQALTKKPPTRTASYLQYHRTTVYKTSDHRASIQCRKVRHASEDSTRIR